MVDRKHITEATDEEIATGIWRRIEGKSWDEAVAVSDDDMGVWYWNVKHTRDSVAALRMAFDFSSPQPPEGVAELLAEADEWVQEENWESSYETDGFNRPGTELIVKLRNALAALSSVPVVTPSDEELLAAYRKGMRGDMDSQLAEHGYASSTERRSLIAGLRAVAALSSAEGTKR